MSVAIVGGAAIGVAGSIYSANKASKAAKRAGKQAAAADQARMDFARERQDEWEATYGATEDHLANYYETLSPTLRTVQGLEAFEKEKDIALTNLRENLDQRGIGTSGIAAQQETDIALASAGERARIRAAAPMEVAKEQSSFLQIGLGQDKYGGMDAALNQQQTNANRDERITAQNSGLATGALVGSVTDLAQAGLTKYVNRTQPVKAPANPTYG